MPYVYIEQVKKYIVKNPSFEKYNFIFHSEPDSYGYSFISKERNFYIYLFLAIFAFFPIAVYFGNKIVICITLFSMASSLLFFVFAGREMHPRTVLLPSAPLALIFGKLFSVEDEMFSISWIVLFLLLLIFCIPIIVIEMFRMRQK